jgi:UDPglucose 6-dehydrogenase
MRIAVAGTGYVGLVVGVALADFGQEVTCVDKDATKIEILQQGRWPIYEPGLPELAERALKAGRLRFSLDLEKTVRNAEAILIAVGTEGLPDGSVNMIAVHEVARQIAASMEDYTVVVTKSTVPVGTAAALTRLIRENQKHPVPFDVVSNPEFQREGSAVKDFIEPYRIIIGTESERAQGIMREIYRPLLSRGVPMVVTTNETAEMIKYAANAFLAMRISYINEIANLCDRLNCDVQAVSRALGMDPRIGPYFLQAGPGYGGSCLPKDTRALVRQAEAAGMNLQITEATVRVNDAQPSVIVHKARQRLGSLAGLTFAVLGLAFKGDTDDVRCSPAVRICELLLAEGARLRVFDPTATRNALPLLSSKRVDFCADPYESAHGAHGLLVVTEWEEFRTLDLRKLRTALAGNLLLDARNMLDPHAAISAGFVYEGVGRRADCADVNPVVTPTVTAKTDSTESK